MDGEVLIEKTTSNIGSFDGFDAAGVRAGPWTSTNQTTPQEWRGWVSVVSLPEQATRQDEWQAAARDCLTTPRTRKNAAEIGKVVERENGAVTARDALQKLVG